MTRKRQNKPASRERGKLLDSVYLLLTALGVVGAILVPSAFLIAHKDSAWMPQGDSAKLAPFAVFAFAFGVLYSYTTWQSRRLHRSLSEKPYLRALSVLNSQWWVSLILSIMGFGVAGYLVFLFVRTAQIGHAVNAFSVVHLFFGIVLVASGVMLLRMTFKGRGKARFTVSELVFGKLFPAVLIISGVVRVVWACRQLVR